MLVFPCGGSYECLFLEKAERRAVSLGQSALGGNWKLCDTSGKTVTNKDLLGQWLILYLSQCMRKPTKCLGENKGADQLCSNCTADQRLCFRYTNSIMSLLFLPKISGFYPASVIIQPCLCRTWLEPKLLVFLCTGSFLFHSLSRHLSRGVG